MKEMSRNIKKTYILTRAPNDDSDQPVSLRSLIRVFVVVRLKKLFVPSHPNCILGLRFLLAELLGYVEYISAKQSEQNRILLGKPTYNGVIHPLTIYQIRRNDSMQVLHQSFETHTPKGPGNSVFFFFFFFFFF